MFIIKILTTSFTLSALFFSWAMAASPELVLNHETSFNPTHHNRFSFMLGFYPSASSASDITNFTFSYGRKMDTFWLDGNLLLTNGLFKRLSANNSQATGINNLEILEQKNTLTSIGFGIGRETRYAQTILPFNDLYEFMAANLTYNSYKEDFSGKTFTGPGILAKFSLTKKFNNYFSIGTHFNYNLAIVKRPIEIDTETSSARSLTLGFLTAGFDLNFYL